MKKANINMAFDEAGLGALKSSLGLTGLSM